MKALLLSLCLSVLLSFGCASRGSIGSFAGPLPEKNAVSAIAADAVSIISELYPPGHTSLHVLTAKDADNSFALALDNGLRARGFTLAAADGGEAVTVAYILDRLEDKSAWYLHLRFADGKATARAYDAQGQPEAGQSRTVLESSRSRVGKAVEAAREKAGNAHDATRDFLKQ